MKKHIKISLKFVLMMFFILPSVKAYYNKDIYHIPHYFDNSPEVEILEWQVDNDRKLEEIYSNPYFFDRVLKYAYSDFSQALEEVSIEELKSLKENNPIVADLLDKRLKGILCSVGRGLTWADKLFHTERYEEVKKEAEWCANKAAKSFFSKNLFKTEQGFDYSAEYTLKKMKEVYNDVYNRVMD